MSFVNGILDSIGYNGLKKQFGEPLASELHAQFVMTKMVYQDRNKVKT